MAQDNITPLYGELTVLGAKRNAAHIEYDKALIVSNAIAASDAWKRWKLAEQQLALAAVKCDRRRAPR